MSLKDLLAQNTVTALPLPTELATVDAGMTAGQAFQVLMENHILSAPVVEAGKGIGLVDMADFVAFIVHLLPEKKPHHESELARLNKELSETPVKKLINYSTTNAWHPVSAKATLLSVVEMLASGVRRVPVLDDAGAVVNLITQSTVLKFIHQHTASLGPVMKQTAAELQFAGGVLTAFQMMAKHHVGSIGVVDDVGGLVTNISLSDIKGVAYEGTMGCLYMSSISYVSAMRQRSTREMSPSISVRTSTPLDTIISKLAATRVHRLFVVNDEHVPVGAVSLTDICRVALASAK